MEEGIQAVKEVIFHLETYDITTIRASVGEWGVQQIYKIGLKDEGCRMSSIPQLGQLRSGN